MTDNLILGVGCNEGQYYFEVLPGGDDSLVYTGTRPVSPALAARVWNAQYRLNNVRRSTHYDDRNWKAEFCRPVSALPSQDAIDAANDLSDRATSARLGVL